MAVHKCCKLKFLRGNKMEKIIHPISGENGYFASEEEKVLIDAILCDYSMNQLVLHESSRIARGVGL